MTIHALPQVAREAVRYRPCSVGLLGEGMDPNQTTTTTTTTRPGLTSRRLDAAAIRSMRSRSRKGVQTWDYEA